MIKQLTFFCELDDEQLLSLLSDGKTIPLLQGLKARVSLSLECLTLTRAECVRLLNQSGIPVVAWLLIPKIQGYWLNAKTINLYRERYVDFAAWVTIQEITFVGVGLDIEPMYQEMEDLFQNKGRFLKMVWSRQFYFDRCQVVSDYSCFVEEIRKDDFSIEVYVWPVMVDERVVGTDFLSSVFGLIPISEVQTTVPMIYESFIPFGLGRSLLQSYLDDGSCTVAIGSTGGGVRLGDLDKRKPLNLVQLFNTLGMIGDSNGSVWIFSLEGCVKKNYLWHMYHSDKGLWRRVSSTFVARLCRSLLQTLFFVSRLWI